ncbi:MAG: cytochrome c oxidase assembly protein [Alphaproteobacteria bacterium]|nr:cytochrome c oxidase assembly protein [Alphaproteobacteria bacterium]
MARGAKANRMTGLAAALAAVLMVGASFAAVPLYRIFCQVTGFGGTTQVASRDLAARVAVDSRVITVSLVGNVNSRLPWSFVPVKRKVSLRLGENALVYYRATNLGDRPVTGVATFNVTPHKAGPYFAKVECFCFTEQTLAPGESVDMPVSFFVDPELAKDRKLDDVTDIALSYTFFQAPGADGDDLALRRAALGRGAPTAPTTRSLKGKD